MTITRSAAASQVAFNLNNINNNSNSNNNNDNNNNNQINKIPIHSLTPPTLVDPNSPTAISYEDDSLGEDYEEEGRIGIVTEAELLNAVVGGGVGEDEEDVVEGYSNDRVIMVPSHPSQSLSLEIDQEEEDDEEEDDETMEEVEEEVELPKNTLGFHISPKGSYYHGDTRFYAPEGHTIPLHQKQDLQNGEGTLSEDEEMAEDEEIAAQQQQQQQNQQQQEQEHSDIDLDSGEVEEEEEVVMEEEEEDEEEEEESEEEDDEIDPKSDGEIDAILQEMQALEESVPMIKEQYKLVDRLGEGTFSSVYKAIDLQHEVFDNSRWNKFSNSSAAVHIHSKEPTAKRDRGKVYVALKRIYVTSSPVRIHNELDILNDLRGGDNVAYLIAALRFEDQVIAVMPFNRHQDFRTYYRHSSLATLRSYFYALFRGLASTHRQSIIHRDVKPANFLYDINTGTGVLCDYGLAQKIGGVEIYEWKAECCHSLPGPSWGGIEGRRKNQELRKRESTQAGSETIAPGLKSGLHGVRLVKPLGLYQQALTMEQEWIKLDEEFREVVKGHLERGDSDLSNEEIQKTYADLEKMKPWIMPKNYKADLKMKHAEKKGWYKSWRPSSMVGLLNSKQERVGYLKEDRRSSVRANRAGTRGFRAPEVLLKCPDQTVALDIWSAGIILLCFLTRRFPFFNSNDDTEALVEIAAMFGRRKMERCAVIHNRTFLTNITTLETPPHPTLHHLVKSLNPSIIVENSPDRSGPIPSTAESDAAWYEGSEICLAVDLLKKTLELDCTKRWTAEECLEHPFFEGLFDLGNGVLGKRELGLLA